MNGASLAESGDILGHKGLEVTRQEASDLLVPVDDWFTEGFDTADVIDNGSSRKQRKHNENYRGSTL
jgi:hypothetical protein